MIMKLPLFIKPNKTVYFIKRVEGIPVIALIGYFLFLVYPSYRLHVVFFSALISLVFLYSGFEGFFIEYRISGREIEKRGGIISKYLTTVQTSKVTDIEVTRSITDRLFGTCNVRINTAGAIGYEINLETIDKNFASLDSLILKTKRGTN